MSKALEDLKVKLLEELQLKEIANPDRQKGVNERLSRGMRDIPVNKMLSQYQYLENELLPRLEKKGGKDGADYKFFSEMLLTILQSISVIDRYEYLAKQHVNQKIYIALQADRMALLESELQKYITLEELITSDALNSRAEAVKKRVEALLNAKKPL